ncbi:MAG: hypothetical protein Q4D98_11880 [Planctomycetia bacterium]|nr:hypothetical protein [Planctomycetia bacterium]
MGGRGKELSVSKNRRFKHSGTSFQVEIAGQSIVVRDIESKDGGSGAPLRAYSSDGYRVRNRENQVSQIILFNPQTEDEHGFTSRTRKVSYEWDGLSGKKDDCPAKTVHKHIWNGDDKQKAHCALTRAEYDKLKKNAGFPDNVQYKVEDGKGGFTYER